MGGCCGYVGNILGKGSRHPNMRALGLKCAFVSGIRAAICVLGPSRSVTSG